MIDGNRGEVLEFPVLDISDEGLALLDADHVLPGEAGDALQGATLKLPGSEIRLGLTLANRFQIYVPQENRRVERVGCIMADLQQADRDTVANYLQRLMDL